MQYRDPGRVLIPIVTPYDDGGAVDYKKLAGLARWLVDTGRADSIIVTGTNGEFPLLTSDERIEAWQVVMDTVSKDVPVIAGTGAASTRETIRLTQKAEELGVDMAMVVGPYYMKPEQDGLYEHYKTVAEATALPIVVYNIPLFTGTNVEPDTLKRLMEVDNIVAVKEEAGLNPAQSSQFILNMRGTDFKFYNGDDLMVVATMAQGAHGTVAGGAHAFGVPIGQLIDAMRDNRPKDAEGLFFKLLPVMLAGAGKGRTNTIPGVRRSVDLLWQPIGPPRMPLLPLDEEETAGLRKALIAAELLEE